jgi:large subunit ribosomal protein L10
MGNLAEKKEKVKQIERVFDDSTAVVVAAYLGVKANNIASLRKSLFTTGATAEVMKNTFVRKGLDSLSINYSDDLITGGNVFVNTNEDIVGMAKVLVGFQKENEKFEIKGAFLNKKFISTSEVQKLSELPSREVLLAMALMRMKSPISGLVRTLSSPINGLVCVLNNIKEKRNGG